MNERHKSICLLSLTLCTQSYSGSKCSPCLAYEELVETLLKIQSCTIFYWLTSWFKMQILISISGIVAYRCKQYYRLLTRSSRKALHWNSSLMWMWYLNPDHVECYLSEVNQCPVLFLGWNNRLIRSLV